jgi:hypothetical protein
MQCFNEECPVHHECFPSLIGFLFLGLYFLSFLCGLPSSSLSTLLASPPSVSTVPFCSSHIRYLSMDWLLYKVRIHGSYILPRLPSWIRFKTEGLAGPVFSMNGASGLNPQSAPTGSAPTALASPVHPRMRRLGDILHRHVRHQQERRRYNLAGR